MKKCFVIMPFTDTIHESNGQEISISKKEWKFIFDKWIQKAVESFGYEDLKCHRSAAKPGNFVKGIMTHLYQSYIVIADITGSRPNVYYELGIRHALRPRTLIITQDRNSFPSDLSSYHHVEYDYSSSNYEQDEKYEKFKNEIHEQLHHLLNEDLEPDSPVLDFLDLSTIKESELDKKIDGVGTRPKSLRQTIFVFSNGSHKKMDIRDIRWITADGAYSRLHTLYDDYVFSKSMAALVGEIESKVEDASCLLKIHKSTIVNAEHISAVIGNQILIGQLTFTIGKNYIDEVKDFLRIV